MAKVIRGGNIFFEDDIKIIDAELDCPLNLPAMPIFSRDELQIFYNGHVFVASKKPDKDKQIKVYTMTFGLEETDSPKAQEERYFSDNSAVIDKLKRDFVERVINGISVLDMSTRGDISQLGKELAERINQRYSAILKPAKQTSAGSGLIAKLEDGSIFNSEVSGCERVLILDKKVYELLTMREYISIFKESFDSSFYKKVQEACNSSTLEEISKMMLDNKDKIHRKVLPMVRNRIWHSDRSFRLYLDETYWIPQFRDNTSSLVTAYQKLIEKKVKIDAAGGIK
jgi:hypothetical protein